MTRVTAADNVYPGTDYQRLRLRTDVPSRRLGDMRAELPLAA